MKLIYYLSISHFLEKSGLLYDEINTFDYFSLLILFSVRNISIVPLYGYKQIFI